MPTTPATSTITPITLADFSICSASSSEHYPTIKPGRGTPQPSPERRGSPPIAEVVNRHGHQLLHRPRTATDHDHPLAPATPLGDRVANPSLVSTARPKTEFIPTSLRA